MIANWIADERSDPAGSEPRSSALAALAEPGTSFTRASREDEVEGIDETDAELLRLVVEGLERGDAERLGIAEVDVTRRLTTTYAKIGASSRADATAFAFQSGMV